jgi:prepilin-type N-terminal cleavage/methylation domain-containing protein
MRHTKYAFTLVEILIVVAILGILAAIALPTLQGHIQQARESAAKEDLRILRNAIALYATQHNDVPPGYPDDDPSQDPLGITFVNRLVKTGDYISEMPKNPFNNNGIPRIILDAETFPTEATGEYGWIYKPKTKNIRLDWPGTDSKGDRYFDY